MAQQFSATIYKLGINPCVEVPLRVSRAFDIRGYIPVVGALNRQPVRATLVPIGGGRHRLFINGDMMKRAHVDVADRIKLTLDLDIHSRTVPMPQGLAPALRRNRAAKGIWERLAPSKQKEILRYLNSAKRPETLQRNITKAIAVLSSRQPGFWGIRVPVISDRND